MLLLSLLQREIWAFTVFFYCFYWSGIFKFLLYMNFIPALNQKKSWVIFECNNKMKFCIDWLKSHLSIILCWVWMMFEFFRYSSRTQWDSVLYRHFLVKLSHYITVCSKEGEEERFQIFFVLCTNDRKELEITLIVLVFFLFFNYLGSFCTVNLAKFAKMFCCYPKFLFLHNPLPSFFFSSTFLILFLKTVWERLKVSLHSIKYWGTFTFK